ncbi:MAG: lysA [Rickettsiaceae bacterium]|jgi:diaminopimelate decarboxylase|nr:lysA [Rickettsiaceae bacterium]
MTQNFSYKNNQLFAENLAISEIAKKVGTPFYCYSKNDLVTNYQNFASAFAGTKHKICYAIKANPNINIAKIFAGFGAGIDAVSMGEIYRALKAGIDPKKIVFAGVGKTREEMAFALKNKVEEFSIESEPELFLLSEVATALNLKAKIALRVNPNVDAKTHSKISTGKKGDKFGIDIEEAPRIYNAAKNLPGIEVFGISTHIGSQITSIAPFKAAFLKIRDLFLELKSQGFDIRNLDFGGGVGILYNDETPILISDYADLIKEIIKDLDVELTIAPGRAMVGNAGILVSEIIYIKKTSDRDFLVIDAAMNDLMRPGLYDSYHKVIPVVQKNGEESKFDIAGPVCESTDILAKNRHLIDPKPGELIVFLSAGAYGASMSNEYNSRPLIPEVLVDGEKFEIIRRRPSYEEMVQLELA